MCCYDRSFQVTLLHRPSLRSVMLLLQVVCILLMIYESGGRCGCFSRCSKRLVSQTYAGEKANKVHAKFRRREDLAHTALGGTNTNPSDATANPETKLFLIFQCWQLCDKYYNNLIKYSQRYSMFKFLFLSEKYYFTFFK